MTEFADKPRDGKEHRMTAALIEWLRTWGQLSLTSGAILALIVLFSNFVLIPRTLLTLSIGALYGLPAIPIFLPSALAGVVLAFLTSRYLFHDLLQRRIDRYPRLRAIADAIDSESWRIVAVLRLASPVPTTIQNYFFGLTRIRLLPYTVASFFFSLPQVLMYVYVGAMGRQMLIEESTSSAARIFAVVGMACVATAAFVIWRKAQASLKSLIAAP